MMVYCNIWSFIDASKKCYRGVSENHFNKSAYHLSKIHRSNIRCVPKHLYQNLILEQSSWVGHFSPSSHIYNSASSIHLRLINMLKRPCHGAGKIYSLILKLLKSFFAEWQNCLQERWMPHLENTLSAFLFKVVFHDTMFGTFSLLSWDFYKCRRKDGNYLSFLNIRLV